MSSHIPVHGVHHLTLTVTDLIRSQRFYMDVLGFVVAAEMPPSRVILSNDDMFLGLSLPLKPEFAPSDDHFNENRVGLDHLSFSLSNAQDLKEAALILDEQNIPHGDITDFPAFGISVLTFCDPDGIQLELTAPSDILSP